MRIVWHGHACFEIDDGGRTIVIDPHDGKSIGIKPPRARADLVLVTHDHFDHNAVRMVQREGTRVIAGREDEPVGKDIDLKVIKGYHDSERGQRRGVVNMYLFTVDGVNFCHVGDLGHIIDDEILKEFDRPIDILFVPVGGHFTIDGREAQEVVDRLKPKVAVPMHYKISGLTLPIKGPEEFLEGFANVNMVGGEIDILPEELSDIESTEVWQFSL